MNQKTHKYIVTYNTTVWDNTIEAPIEKESNSAKIVFNEFNILEDRKLALKKAESLLDLFRNDGAIKYEAITPFEPKTSGSEIVMLYEVKVELEIENSSLCIYTIGETGYETEVVLNNLKKEYDILKGMNINLKYIEKSIEVYNAKTKIMSTVTILENGMDWSNAEINVIDSLRF